MANPRENKNKNYVYGRVLYKPSHKVKANGDQSLLGQHNLNHDHQYHHSSMSTLRHLNGQPMPPQFDNPNNQDETFGRILLSPSKHNIQQEQQQELLGNKEGETSDSNINNSQDHQARHSGSTMTQQQTNGLTFWNGSNKPSTLHVLKQQLEPATLVFDRLNNIALDSDDQEVTSGSGSTSGGPSSNNNRHSGQTSSSTLQGQNEFEGTFISPALEEAYVTSNDSGLSIGGGSSEGKNRGEPITVVKNSRNNFSVL